MMTQQEMFNKAVLGVVTQGRPSRMGSRCLYRLNREKDDQVRCAIGHLIPDEVYDPKLEYFGAREITSGVVYEINLPMELSDPQNADFLVLLQRAHDVAAHESRFFVNDFFRRCTHIAEEFHLTMPELPNAASQETAE